ncbi:RNA polymerase sigma factor [Steroidobacter sp.]|uniref:RNA polymerase sigma factor n=1 Tax=Steroidobacter sp. TaxID=1978227 RepID=UPI001A5D68F4|nr:sigma-70 family RNA polymerase sigma factor [Steroidobacter sp.]MBL8268365.1 sigma-70 family RNA polymerase sigma factor [Steroidobacter sp.]
MSESVKAWFVREVLVHEELLVNYLIRVWPRRDEVADLRQEIYIRVYQSGMTARPASAKAFLFATARHLMIERIRRQRVIAIDTVGDLDALNVLIDEISPEQRVKARQELRRLAVAFDALPPKCRDTVWLRRVDQLSQNEVADRLGISPRTVEKHLMKGIRQLANAMLGTEFTATQDKEDSDAGEEQSVGRERRR